MKIHLVARILQIPVAQATIDGNPQALARRTIESLVDLVVLMADGRPLLVVAEDVLASSRVMDEEGEWACVSVLEEPGPVAASMLGDRLQSVREGRLPHSDT